jgi:hypothetical protein
MDQHTFMHLAQKHKKPIIIGILAISATMILLVSLVIWGAYKVFLSPSQTQPVAVSIDKETLTTTPSPESVTTFGNAALAVFQGALTESLKSQEGNSFVDGLACVNAMGGPAPDVMIQHLRSRLSDEKLQSKLSAIEKQITNQVQSRGSTACVSWFMGG